MFCPNCGTNCPDGAAFCQNCGTKLTNEQEIQSPVSEQTFPLADQNANDNEFSGFKSETVILGEPTVPLGTDDAVFAPAQSDSSAQSNDFYSYSAPQSPVAENGQFNAPQNSVGYQTPFGNFADNQTNTTDAFYGNGYVPPKKKKSKKPLVIILSILIVIAGLAVIFKGFTVNLFRNLFYSNEKYMSAVISDDIEKYSKDFTENYGRALNEKNPQAKGDITVKLSKQGADILEELTGEDFSELKNASLSIESATKGDSAYAGGTLKVNGKKFTSAKFIIDDGDLYGQSDLLGKDYYDLSANMPKEASESFSSISEIRNILPSEKKLNKIITRYAKIATSKLEDVEKSKETVDFGDLSVKTTELTAEIDSDLAYSVVTALLEEVKDDDDIKTIISDIAESDLVDEGGEKTVEEFEDGIEDVLDKLDEDDFKDVDDIDCEFTVNVDSTGNIVCRKISVNDVTISVYSIDKSKKFAYGIEVKSGSEKASVIVEGKTSSHKYTGDLRVKYGETSFKVASFEDMDFHKIANGKCSGKLIISGEDLPLDFLSSVLDDEYLDYLKNGEIIFDFDLSPDKASILLDITYNGDSVLMFTLDSKDSKVNIPDVDDALDPDDIDEDVLDEAGEKIENFFGDFF